MELIDKSALIAEIKRRIKEIDEIGTYLSHKGVLTNLLCHLDTIDTKEVNLELENENNTSKITVGTKIRSKTNTDVILSIISNDCHEDEFECSNGSVLSLKQIEKYYDIIM